MPLPERTIESAIDALKSTPGKFQRLVERYAQLTYPHRFKELVPGGRAPGDVTVKGWPDIYARSPDRLLMDVVEATHSPEWSRHLKEDVEKAEALGKGRLSGFIFVAWANEPSPLTDHKKPNPLDEKLTSYRGRLVALGIPPENITFVFKKQLVRDLTQPNFASVLTEFLELQSHSLPFRTISAANIYGTPGQHDVFAPAKEEYLNGFVHRAAITGEVEKRLESLGWAWLRGRGAAGKTVLAIHIGRAYEAKSLPAYYLDLSKWEGNVSQALNVITTHADDGVLFIIDNVHLNQASARDCFDHWQSVSGGSHLLLVGRDTTTIDFRGIALPLDDLREEALTLEVSQDDLKGVFLRLARTSLSSSNSIPRPPQDVLERWHRLFGGDLIAFSAAVAQRLKRLAQNEWAIQAQDAAKYVRAAYLGKADEAQRLNLLRLAVLAQLEMSVPEEALELTKLEPFLQNGLVHFVGRGRNNQNSYYHLVHPGLGDLLLTAVGYSDEELKRFISEQWGYISHRNPLVGTQIAARLESSTRLQEAALILKGIIAIEKGLEAILITPGLQYLRINSERLARLGILSESEIDQKLASLNSEIYQSALSSSLNFLAHSLRYAERKLPLAWEALAVEFQRPEGVVKLHEMALRTPLDFVVNLLAYAERKLPLVWEALAAEFQRPEGIAALREVALRTPLDLLVNFLVYAQQKLPLAWQALAAEFQRLEGIAALHEMALRAPLNQLVSLLGYADRKLPLAWQALVAEFQRPEGVAKLYEMALRAPFNQLVSFLGYAERKLPLAWEALAVEFQQPEGVVKLHEAALRAPLNQMASFLGYAERKLPLTWEALAAEFQRPEGIAALHEMALRTPLDLLVNFLGYAEQKLPLAWKALAAEFQQPEGIAALHEITLRVPLDQLVSFLGYAEQKLPLAWEALAAEFQQPEGIAALHEVALRTPLDLLVNFLWYAEQKLPLAWEALAVEFQRPEGVAKLHEMALRTPLDFVVNLLAYAERKLPLTWEALAAEFQRPEGIAALCEMALRAPLDQLASLLGFTEQKLPMLGQALTEKLTDPVMIKLLAETACRTPLSNLLGFLQTVTFAPTVVFAIDQDQWTKSRQEGRSEQPYYFPAIAKVFQRIGRPELSEAPAISLIKDANQQHWRGPGIGLHHLSYVMRLGRATEAKVMLNFITRVATPTWLKELYSEAPAYGIAAALFGLWGYYEKAVLDHFCIGALKSRVRYELNNLSRMGLEDLSGSLQLLGVSALLGVRVGIFKMNWPKVDQVNDLTQLVLPPAETTTIGYITIQLWLGLRVMAGMRPDHIYIQPALGEHVLALWKNSTGNTDKQNELNQWMIEWMQRCAQAEWRLIADHRKG